MWFLIALGNIVEITEDEYLELRKSAAVYEVSLRAINLGSVVQCAPGES